MDKIIRWGMIGCGSVTEVKSGPAFNKVACSQLFGVMRRDAIKLKDYASRHTVPYFTTDANALINHPEIDAIYIATPPKYHQEYAIAAMNAGKHVYVEKPMALNVAACLSMKEAAEKLNAKLVIAHYRRELPLFMHVKKLIQEQAIGKVHSVNIIMHKYAKSKEAYATDWRVKPAIAGAGFFYDLAPHQLDLVFYFFGKAISFSGSATNQAGIYEAEDTVNGIIQMENDILVKGNWCFAVEPGAEKDLFEIIGTNGKISFPVFGHEILVEKEGTLETIAFDPPMHNQQNLIAKIVPYFLGVGENPCDAEEAIQSMEVMEAFVYGENNA
jgi:predicted dehydrogenase